LKGADIPLAARIFAVVDVWDALLFDRPYRKAWPRNEVVSYLNEHADVRFDPKIVREFLRMVSEDERP
jgi:HD-GYP domain-containing protein (c-di-GMP phosphodiesterase class II)